MKYFLSVIDETTGSASSDEMAFVESKEYLAGCWVIEAPDLDAVSAADVQDALTALLRRHRMGVVDLPHPQGV